MSALFIISLPNQRSSISQDVDNAGVEFDEDTNSGGPSDFDGRLTRNKAKPESAAAKSSAAAFAAPSATIVATLPPEFLSFLSSIQKTVSSLEDKLSKSVSSLEQKMNLHIEVNYQKY